MEELKEQKEKEKDEKEKKSWIRVPKENKGTDKNRKRRKVKEVSTKYRTCRTTYFRSCWYKKEW